MVSTWGRNQCWTSWSVYTGARSNFPDDDYVWWRWHPRSPQTIVHDHEMRCWRKMWWNLNNHWVAQWQPANPRCGTSSYQASLKIHNIYKYITKSRNFYLYFLRKPVELQMPLHCHVSREVRELHLKVVDLAFWWKSFQQYLDQFLGVDWPVPVPRDNIIMIF